MPDHFWISTFDGVGPDREVHVAFTAPDRTTVRVPEGDNVEACSHAPE